MRKIRLQFLIPIGGLTAMSSLLYVMYDMTFTNNIPDPSGIVGKILFVGLCAVVVGVVGLVLDI